LRQRENLESQQRKAMLYMQKNNNSNISIFSSKTVDARRQNNIILKAETINQLALNSMSIGSILQE
jgi:hypothetical protein